MVRIRTHANPLQVPAPEPADWVSIFGRQAPVLLEVGCGRGDFLLALARAHSRLDVVGLEIRRRLVEHVQERARALGLPNAQAALADASRHLGLLFTPASIAAAFVLFPDPWRKQKHLKRRVIRPPFLDLLAPLLLPGGSLDLQTDSLELATEADALVAAHPEWVNVLGAGELDGEPLPDSGSRRCRMHRERGARIFKLRFGLEVAPPPTPRPGAPDAWLGFEVEGPTLA